MAIFNGGAGNDTLTGTGVADSLYGLAGDDTLDGGSGADRMEGGLGDDSFVVDDAADLVVELGGEGWDRVLTALTVYTMPANVEALVYTRTTTHSFNAIGNSLNNWIEGGAGWDMIDGKEGADTMSGYGGNDEYRVDNVGDVVVEHPNAGTDRVTTTLAAYSLGSDVEELVYAGPASVGFQGYGNSLANLIIGGGGNDHLDGGTGLDTLYGYGGDDSYAVDEVFDSVGELENDGYDTVFSTATSFSLSPNLEKLVFVGTGNFTGGGNDLDNVLEGGAGNDYLAGGLGADIMTGKGGDDQYYVTEQGDVVIEQANGGRDRVSTTLAAYVLPDNVEDLYCGAGTGQAFHATGNALNNLIYTESGNDVLDGGAGHDLMMGGFGDDTYFVDHAWDSTAEYADNGNDTVKVSGLASWTLGEHVERLVYLGSSAFTANGNTQANHLETGAGNDVLNGGGGADVLVGKAGDDSYVVDHAGDQTVEEAGGGYDTVTTGLAAFTLAANVEKLVYAPIIPVAFTANGNAGANFIVSSVGDDYLDGGAGADTLQGKGGNDVYVVDNLGDVVLEEWGGGTDEVRTSAGSRTDFTKLYTLPAHVENLTGTAAGAQGVYGNALDNLIKMGAGGDLIVLHDGGNDRVQGGGGDDFLYYGNAMNNGDANDGGAGYDAIGLLGFYHLDFDADDLVSIEKLSVYGSGGTGPAYSYELSTVDANVAAGANLMVVGMSLHAGATLVFNGSAELDGSFNIRGGKGADKLTGGAKGDQIHGGWGADLLTGGGGKDSFEYTSVEDSWVQGRDQILDFAAGDKINLWGIDADGNKANGNSKFAFIGAAKFSGVAGQLRVVDVNGTWLVEGDTNGDAIADLSIFVTTQNSHLLGATDFVL